MPVYKKYTEYYDVEATKKYCKGNSFFDFPQLKITRSTEESKKINNAQDPKMIIAGSGMMNGGRIIHHLYRYLSDPKSTLIIVGYQAKGTLGRKLHEGYNVVHIFGQPVEVKCTIKSIGALSAHGDKAKLFSWISSADKQPSKIFCIHGEKRSSAAFADAVKKELGIDAYVPMPGETIEI